MRIPLRDAVEKRPPPDEAIDYKNIALKTDSALPYGYDLQQELENFYAPYKYFEYMVQDYRRFKPQPVSYPYQQDNSKVTPSINNQYTQSNNRFAPFSINNPYSQYSITPYNINNPYQQLMVSPFGRSARNLKNEQEFFRLGLEDKKGKSL